MLRLGGSALLATALSAALAAGAYGQTESGKLAGSAPSWRVAASVEAISLPDGTVEAAVLPKHGRWSVSLSAGDFFIEGVVANARTGKTTVTAQKLVREASVASAAAAPAVIGMGDVAFVPAPGSSFRAGGSASNSLLTGLLPECKKKGQKVVDRTQKTDAEIQKEKQAGDQGRLDFPIAYNPLAPTVTVKGKVILGDDSATADLKIVNGSTGSLIKHVIVRGDASDFDEELGKFLRFVGGKLADIECGPPPKPKPAPKPGKGLAFSIEYAGTYIDHAADQSGAHVNDLALKWDEVLQGRVSRTGLLTFSPLKLTASGSLTTQNNVNGSSRTDQCIIGPGSVPIQHGGFINLQPQGAGSGLARFRTFQAWASIPLNVANGELAFSLGASGFCQRDDLRPFVAATASVPLPQAWQDVALAQVRGSWLKRIGQPETANFSVQSADGQIADTVSVSAQLSVATNGKIPR